MSVDVQPFHFSRRGAGLRQPGPLLLSRVIKVAVGASRLQLIGWLWRCAIRVARRANAVKQTISAAAPKGYRISELFSL